MKKTKVKLQRINIYVTARQWQKLTAIAEAYGLSASELLRRWLDEKIEQAR